MKQLLFTMILFAGGFSNAQDTTWSKVFTIDAFYESVQLTSAVTLDNGLITISTPVAEAVDGVILRLNPDGTPLWYKNFHGPFALGGLFFSDIIATHDSCYLVSGLVGELSTADYFPFCMKINDSGDILWTKTFDLETPPIGIFGYHFDRYSRICETADSSLLMVWRHESYDNGSPNSTPDHMCVSKMSSGGNLLWTSSMIVDSSFYATDIVEDENQSILVVGNTGNADGNGYLIELSDNGDFNWAKTYEDVVFDEIIPDSTGFAVSWWDMSLQSSGIMKLDPAGVNTKRVSFSGWLSEVQPSFDRRDNGNYLLSQRGDNYGGGLIMEISDTLELVSTYSIMMMMQSIRSIPNYGVYAVGFGPMYGVKSIFNETGVVRYDSLMNTAGLCSWPEAYTISVDATVPDQSVFFTSADSIIEIQIPITNSSTFGSSANECVTFISSVEEIDGAWNETISPNPSSGEFTISWNEYRDAEIVIYSALGSEVYRSRAKNSFVEINLGPEQSGLYYYRLTDENGSQSNGKLILIE